MTGTIAVIVPSFNRPRMLAEALASIVGADQVIVADDGSTFDVAAAVRTSAQPDALIVANLPIEPLQRMRQPTCGALVNQAIRLVTCDYLTLLCDDDLLAPDWLPAVVKHFDSNPTSHMCRGDWLRFEDGADPLTTARECVWDCDPPLTTGNFAVRTECAGGCGCWWSEDTVSCHDAAYLDAYLRKHGSRDIGHVGVLAGYRREHAYNMLRWMGQKNDYKPETLALFERGRLEPVG